MSENHSRAEFFVSLGELCDIIPEMRAGQILAAIGELCADLHGRGLWEAADDELRETVWQFRRNFEAANVSQVREMAEQSGEGGDEKWIENKRGGTSA